ncbi:MAG: hypothetical protein OEM64_12890, partial [Gammaproteobacteria bacterium]|nr:hypothetical protein [Gammaproteobacteria bacterium]
SKTTDTSKTSRQRRPARAKPSAASGVQSPAWQDPDWGQLVAQLGLTGAARLLASNCALLRREGNTVHLGLDPRSESLLTKQRENALATSLSQHFGERLVVKIGIESSVGAETPETPVQEESRMADERMEAERRKLEADPNVQAMKTIFGAEVQTESIELINPSQSD